jgi:ubiquinone/menaquinone biosynthesis C-methylase UbiE
MRSSEEVKEFYDNYQFKFRHNVRHYIIINKLLDFGLKNDSKVLEIGCGNGALSKLILKNIPKGGITALDISSESISRAKINLKEFNNVEYIVSDVSNFDTNEKYDFVVLSDVLEHIPLETHNELFKKLYQILKLSGVIFINIPEPALLEWVTQNEPEKLQVIDQPIHSDILMKNAYQNGFYLKELKTYSIFTFPSDSQYILFVKKDNKFNYKQLPKWKILYKKYLNFFKSNLK